MIPESLYYSSEHEWVRLDKQVGKLGITHYAQDSLGDIVYLELPEPGTQVKLGQEIAEVESTKTASPIYTPVSGKILAINEELKDKPELVNQDPYGKGWIMKIQLTDQAEIDKLMNAASYREFLESKSE